MYVRLSDFVGPLIFTEPETARTDRFGNVWAGVVGILPSHGFCAECNIHVVWIVIGHYLALKTVPSKRDV